MRKGILLTGGRGTRLHPMTISVSKQLLPVFDKPMIYYSLSVLMLAGIKDILIISTSGDMPHFKAHFGDGGQLGLKFSYALQEQPNGIAEAFLIGAEFIGSDPVTLMLGDNIFFGAGLGHRLRDLIHSTEAVIFSYSVKNPAQYGVIQTDAAGRVRSIEEKPEIPKTNDVVTGLYYYPNDVVEFARTLQPSARQELEITDINNIYLNLDRLRVEKLGRGYAWLDVGTAENLLEASNFIALIERRQGLRIGCIEEIAWRLGWITTEELAKLGEQMESSAYADYVLSLTGTGGIKMISTNPTL